MTLHRRQLLKTAASLAIGLPLPGILSARAQYKADPFSLGIASGEPASDGFVIWTKLAPEPFAFRGGMPLLPTEATWEGATDPAMRAIVRSGLATTRIETAHSVHVEVGGLEPARDYFY